MIFRNADDVGYFILAVIIFMSVFTYFLGVAFLVFIGMYDGDGNKTNNIGFAQNEQHLQNFVTDNLKIIFKDSFEEEVTILEDTKYFEGEDLKSIVKNLKKNNPKKTEKEIFELILEKEFTTKFGYPPPDNTRYVISPLKGARKLIQALQKNHDKL